MCVLSMYISYPAVCSVPDIIVTATHCVTSLSLTLSHGYLINSATHQRSCVIRPVGSSPYVWTVESRQFHTPILFYVIVDSVVKMALSHD